MGVTSTDFIESRFGYDDKGANGVTALPNLISAIASPIAGIVMDRFGRRPPFICLGCLMFIFTYIGFIIYPASNKPVGISILYCVYGAALSLFGSVIWPCVPLVVEKNLVGTAIGLTTALQNFGMAVSPTALTALQTKYGFTYAFLYI